MSQEVRSLPGILELPIFPLPNVVFFPRTLLPLHVFEPRYLTMVQHAWQGERRLGIALLRPGWERDYEGTPPVYPVGGMGAIQEVHPAEGGRLNLVLSGQQRYRIIDFKQWTPYRIARVQLLSDQFPPRPEVDRLSRSLIESFLRLAEGENMAPQAQAWENLDFQTLVNRICASLQVSPEHKQRLLEMDHLEQRAQSLLHLLEHLLSQQALLREFGGLRPRDPRRN